MIEFERQVREAFDTALNNKPPRGGPHRYREPSEVLEEALDYLAPRVAAAINDVTKTLEQEAANESDEASAAEFAEETRQQALAVLRGEA